MNAGATALPANDFMSSFPVDGQVACYAEEIEGE
jgi:hypothetical protein